VYKAFSIGRQGSKREIFNPNAVSLFRDGFDCPWKRAGVWTDEGGAPRLLRPDHFSMFEGRQANFVEDFLKPFTLRYIEKMKESDERIFFFIEGAPGGSKQAAHTKKKKNDPPNVINAFHWYDGFSLFTKSFHPWFTMSPEEVKLILGRKKVAGFFTGSLAKGVEWSRRHMGGIPCLLGEFGLAFDMNKRRGINTGGYSPHEEALSMYYDAVDANLLHSTIWNYTADNTGKYGDGWNDEDLSIFSEGKERAAAGWKRPYPMATAGEPLSIKWDRKRGVFRYRFNADNAVAAPTVIYLPEEFGPSPEITVSPAAAGGTAAGMPPRLRFEYRFEELRLLVFNEGFGGEVEVAVKRGTGEV
jgi:hypothetical protein